MGMLRLRVLLGCSVILGGGIVQGADKPAAPETFRQYCIQCHGKTPMAGVNLDQMTSQRSVADSFSQWEKVVGVLQQKRMPPKGMPQPSDAERQQAIAWVKTELNTYAKLHDGEPGRVTVRRLTSGEYGYAIHDLTGLDLDVGIDPASDSVGGEGFTNFGDVQFMQDSNLERYLEGAKLVADHAVVGSGPLEFFTDPGKTGFELSAITRIKNIYAENGIRTVSGEGGRPFGLERYGKAFYVAWLYRNRVALGEPNATLLSLAKREGVSVRFAQHIWSVMNMSELGYPVSEVVARWRKLAAPSGDLKAATAKALADCTEIQKFLVTWPSWLFARGDVAAGGAGDESPLVISDASLKVEATHHFRFFAGGRPGRGRGPATGSMKIYLNIAGVNPGVDAKAAILWKNPTIAVLRGGPGRGAPAAGATADDAEAALAAAGAGALRRGGPAGPRDPLRKLVSAETAARLNFGLSPDGSAIGPDDFASDSSVWFEVPLPQGAIGLDFQVDAEIGKYRDQVFRITFSDREDGGSRGIPTRAILGDPKSAGYQTFKSGVLELAALLPPNTHVEPTPADKDPAPAPLDSTFNTPEHDAFETNVKYIRDDRFVYDKMLDDATRIRLDRAWNDLYAAFEYHDNYIRLLAEHFKVDLHGKHIADLTEADLKAMPADARRYIAPLVTQYKAALAAEAAARPMHVEDCLRFASRAWRRPLTEKEKASLRAFYDSAMTVDPDHTRAIKALLARILVAPGFLYRVEYAAAASPVRPLSNWEMASRLSFFLWSSIPDDELRRAAAAGELTVPATLEKQVKRMLADPKSRRLATEFFGQWLGFYRFDHHRGVDTGRFPEFTEEVKSAMYDEAVSFFEHIIRKDRPVSEMLTANYTFLNKPLAKHYGVTKEVKSADDVEMVEGADEFHRGGMLRLGAVLTATSAPLRTSPVKRGDWVLRRILGTPTPPPPADAGSIPADDKLFGGLSVHEKLEAHKRNATCANCHTRIDPLGFPLEHYDSVGRWRDKYPDGKAIYDSGVLTDQTQIAGVKGLLDYVESKESQVQRTLSFKLIGYALGRTVQPSDRPLIERMVSAGADAPFSTLVANIVSSKQFRNHLGKDENPPAAPVKTAAAGTSKVGGE